MLDPLDIHYTIRRTYVDLFLLREAARLPAGGLVLDNGGHREDKRGRFDIFAFPFHTLTSNIADVPPPDVLCDAAALSFASETFDAIVCSEVLEHVPDPRPVIAECARILKSGGVMLITVPFMYQIHADPHDYGRYTHFYWQEVLTAAGFGAIEIEKQGGLWSVIADFLRAWARWRAKHTGRWWQRLIGYNTWILLFARLLRRIAWRLDAGKPRAFYSNFPTGFGIRAVKS